MNDYFSTCLKFALGPLPRYGVNRAYDEAFKATAQSSPFRFSMALVLLIIACIAFGLYLFFFLKRGSFKQWKSALRKEPFVRQSTALFFLAIASLVTLSIFLLI